MAKHKMSPLAFAPETFCTYHLCFIRFSPIFGYPAVCIFPVILYNQNSHKRFRTSLYFRRTLRIILCKCASTFFTGIVFSICCLDSRNVLFTCPHHILTVISHFCFYQYRNIFLIYNFLFCFLQSK